MADHSDHQHEQLASGRLEARMDAPDAYRGRALPNGPHDREKDRDQGDRDYERSHHQGLLHRCGPWRARHANTLQE